MISLPAVAVPKDFFEAARIPVSPTITFEHRRIASSSAPPRMFAKASPCHNASVGAGIAVAADDDSICAHGPSVGTAFRTDSDDDSTGARGRDTRASFVCCPTAPCTT